MNIVRLAPVTLLASSIGLAGCRPAVPDVSGTWHATAQMMIFDKESDAGAIEFRREK
jgi:hypothetical protein